jgi:hypothetical protein
MKRSFAAAAMAATVALGATLVMAASPQVESAIKTLRAVAGDPGKLKTYCDLQAATDAIGEKEDAAAEARIESLTKQLGPDFEKAFETAENLDENSADGKAFYAAADELDGKCGRK